jgi:transposase, IS5 family
VRRRRRTALIGGTASKTISTEVERAKNRVKSTVRSKVEHVFGVMKLQFGFVKICYRGLAKNANRLFATCALVNLFMVRNGLLSALA